MRALVASDFSPEIVHFYNASASPILAGCGVMRYATPVAIPDAANPNAPVTYIMGIQYATASIAAHQHNLIGVAVETISPSTYGPVCIGGPCTARIGTSASYSAGCPLGIDSATPGSFVEIAVASTSSDFSVPLYNVSASVDVAIDDMLNVFVEPVKVAGGQGFFL